MTPDSWRLYAVQYATSTGRPQWRNVITSGHGVLSQEPGDISFFIWVAIRGDRVVLIDGGADRPTVEARGFEWSADPVVSLASIGIVPEAVTDVVITHLHWDHAGNLSLFPNARIHLTQTEWEWATGSGQKYPFICRPLAISELGALGGYISAGRVRLLPMHEEQEIAPGLSVIGVGGHTAGNLIVRVQGPAGSLVLAGDAAHTYQNLTTFTPFPVVLDVPQYLDALVLATELAGDESRVVPGHDPRITKDFTPLPGSEFVTQLHPDWLS